jgi:hypothetical protein
MDGERKNMSQARKILQELSGKLDEVENRQHILAGERTAIAYDALCGDAKAAKRLDAINVDLSVIDQEIASAKAAIAEAVRRVSAEDASKRSAVDTEKRQKAQGVGQAGQATR